VSYVQGTRFANDKAKTLEKQPNISQVQIIVHYGSVCINYHARNGSLEDVLAILQDIGLIIVDLGDGTTDAAAGISSVVVNLN